jgi:hypothetical protein
MRSSSRPDAAGSCAPRRPSRRESVNKNPVASTTNPVSIPTCRIHDRICHISDNARPPLHVKIGLLTGSGARLTWPPPTTDEGAACVQRQSGQRNRKSRVGTGLRLSVSLRPELTGGAESARGSIPRTFSSRQTRTGRVPIALGVRDASLACSVRVWRFGGM